jgi:hypothetical protein
MASFEALNNDHSRFGRKPQSTARETIASPCQRGGTFRRSGWWRSFTGRSRSSPRLLDFQRRKHGDASKMLCPRCPVFPVPGLRIGAPYVGKQGCSPHFAHRRIYSGGSMIGGLHSDQHLNSSVERLRWDQDGYRRDRNNGTPAWALLAKTADLFDAGNLTLRPRLTAR